MAKLTWTIVSVDGTVARDGPVISDANMDRFIDWLWVHYPQFEVDGITPKPRNVANEAQAFRDWADVQWAGTKANVLSWERNVAGQAASDAITDIT